MSEYAEIAVVTRVAPPTTGRNLAAAMDIVVEKEPPNEANGYEGLYQPEPLAFMAGAMRPVFAVGEILLLGSDGREVVYPGRKPAKWDVDVETVPDLDTAVRRSQELTETLNEQIVAELKAKKNG